MALSCKQPGNGNMVKHELRLPSSALALPSNAKKPSRFTSDNLKTKNDMRSCFSGLTSMN